MPPKLTEETVAENVLNVGKEKDIQIQKATEFQIRWSQKDTYQDTLKLKW